MDRRFINRTNKRLKVLGALKNDLNQMAGKLVEQIEDPELKKKLIDARRAAQKGDKSQAEALLKNLQTK